ncbi:hypothetical protein BsWGS_26795 [Bradybaena similaris]
MAGDRGSWGSWVEFLLSALGTLVGLGNVWRFPYVCYRSGGGAFLIPFLVALLVCGCPILFLETLYCQYSNLGPGKVWVICPLFKGIGFGMMTMTFVVSVYYTMIMGWTLHYLAMSFSPTLPWTQCRPDSVQCRQGNVSTADLGAYNLTGGATNDSRLAANSSFVSPEEEYWFKSVLNVSSGIDHMGGLRWQLLLCLLAAWVVVFLCLIKGIHSLGKVVYVAATLPYFILTCLLIRGCLLPGAREGLHFYMVPDWSKLAEFEVWRSAATQVFFSVGLGFGVLSTLASYNKFHNNCYRDAMMLPVLDCATSIYAGLVIFAYLGHMSHTSGKSIHTVVAEGPGLVFIAYPAALSTLPLPQLWSVLFFLMLFCVGLDSQFVHIQTLCAALIDCFPGHPLTSRKTLLMGCMCVVSFVLGIPLTLEGGSYVLHLMDWYVASMSVMLLVFIEIVVLAWIYGTDRLYQDVELMIGRRPHVIYKVAWKFVTPIFVLVLWTSGVINFQTIGSVYPGYPPWADILGLLISVLSLVPIPIKMVWTLVSLEGSLLQRVKRSVRPTQQWKPAQSAGLELELEFLNK